MTITICDASTICVIVSAKALVRVINYAPRVPLKIVASLTDDSWGIIYDHNVFIVQGPML